MHDFLLRNDDKFVMVVTKKIISFINIFFYSDDQFKLQIETVSYHLISKQ